MLKVYFSIYQFLNINIIIAQNFYFGDLHVHSTLSFDYIKGTPQEIYFFVKDSTKLDFICITDHENNLFPSIWRYSKLLVNKYNIDITGVDLNIFLELILCCLTRKNVFSKEPVERLHIFSIGSSSVKKQ